jgi:hypothetical protein
MSAYPGLNPYHRLVKSEVSTGIKIYTAVFWGRGVVKGTNISEIPSASIFRVEDELAGSSTEVFTVPYFTLRPSTDVTCTSDFFPFTHCSDKLPLFSTAQTDSPPPPASSQRTNGESEAQKRQHILEYASAAE